MPWSCNVITAQKQQWRGVGGLLRDVKWSKYHFTECSTDTNIIF